MLNNKKVKLKAALLRLAMVTMLTIKTRTMRILSIIAMVAVMNMLFDCYGDRAEDNDCGSRRSLASTASNTRVGDIYLR